MNYNMQCKATDHALAAIDKMERFAYYAGGAPTTQIGIREQMYLWDGRRQMIPNGTTSAEYPYTIDNDILLVDI